jgi:hypothetical protein
MTDEPAEHDAARAAASTEYAEDDYDPVADRRIDERPSDEPPGDGRDGRAAESAAPPRSNMKRIVLGIVGLVVSLLLLNAGLNILSQPPDSPTPSAPPPSRPPGTPTTAPAPTTSAAPAPTKTAVS